MATKLDVLYKLRNIFREIFDDEDMIITEETSRKDIEDWDSVAHVKLVLAIEAEFNIRFTTEEVSTIKTVGDFLNVIEKH